MAKQLVTLVVAMNDERVIGVDNHLPWKIPEDMQYFKAVTLGKPIIMGRKTFESIGRILPDRTNIVITRQLSWGFPGVHVFHNLKSALVSMQSFPEVCVIGGAQIYEEALPYADELLITWVNLKLSPPYTTFPDFDINLWTCSSTTKIISATNNIHCSFNRYVRNDVV